MSSFKEPTTSRPASHHRVSSSSTPLNVPGRHASGNGSGHHHHHHRQHAHSVSLGNVHSHGASRVSRRKSLTANHLAVVVQQIDDASLEALVAPESRIARRTEMPARIPSGMVTARSGKSDDADVKMEHDAEQGDVPLPRSVEGKARNRRASEGAHVTKDAKRVSSDLKCDKCGKGYKHSSCLTKHLWEHTPEWAFTSKLLISKHQQVQLLEAASVLVTMNQDPPVVESDHSSASPEASGSSEQLDEAESSSVETTPPPMGDATDHSKRYSTNSSMYSHSYQSVQSTPFAIGSVPSSSYGSYHQSTRPSTSGTPYSALPMEDEAGLAAAVKLVNFGTPRSIALAMDDVPPVPPLPAQYAAYGTTPSTTGLEHGDIALQPMTHRMSDERDSKMPPASVISVDVEFEDRRSVSRGHSEHEDGFFGRMEE